MPEPETTGVRRSRARLGGALLGLSFVPWGLAALAPWLERSPGRLAAWIAGLLAAGEILGAAALLVLGKEAHARILGRFRRRRSRARAEAAREAAWPS